MTQTKSGSEAPPSMKPSYSVEMEWEELQELLQVELQRVLRLPSRAFSKMEKSSSSVEGQTNTIRSCQQPLRRDSAPPHTCPAGAAQQERRPLRPQTHGAACCLSNGEDGALLLGPETERQVRERGGEPLRVAAASPLTPGTEDEFGPAGGRAGAAAAEESP